jgi:hypothetical protein
MVFFRLLVALGFFVLLGLSACAGNSGSLQSRIENKVQNPEGENVHITIPTPKALKKLGLSDLTRINPFVSFSSYSGTVKTNFP